MYDTCYGIKIICLRDAKIAHFCPTYPVECKSPMSHHSFGCAWGGEVAPGAGSAGDRQQASTKGQMPLKWQVSSFIWEMFAKNT